MELVTWIPIEPEDCALAQFRLLSEEPILWCKVAHQGSGRWLEAIAGTAHGRNQRGFVRIVDLAA